MNDETSTTDAPAEEKVAKKLPSASSPFPKNLTAKINRFKMPLIGGLAVLLILIAVGFSASRSLPGEKLYAVKTNVIEGSLQMLHLSSKSKAEFQIHRMEARLDETKALAKQSAVSQKAISDITAQANKHSQLLRTIVASSTDGAFPKTDVLFTLNTFASVSQAMESLSEPDPKLAAFGDTMEDIRSDAINLYKKRAQSFVETETPQTALAYIQAQLADVKKELDDASIPKETVKDADNYLERVGFAIKDQDFTKAIVSIGESYRIIKIQKYSGIIPVPPAPHKTASSTTKTGSSTLLEASSTGQGAL